MWTCGRVSFRLDTQVKKLRRWLGQMEQELSAEVQGGRPQSVAERTAELQRVERFHKGLLKERYPQYPPPWFTEAAWIIAMGSESTEDVSHAYASVESDIQEQLKTN